MWLSDTAHVSAMEVLQEIARCERDSTVCKTRATTLRQRLRHHRWSLIRLLGKDQVSDMEAELLQCDAESEGWDDLRLLLEARLRQLINADLSAQDEEHAELSIVLAQLGAFRTRLSWHGGAATGLRYYIIDIGDYFVADHRKHINRAIPVLYNAARSCKALLDSLWAHSLVQSVATGSKPVLPQITLRNVQSANDLGPLPNELRMYSQAADQAMQDVSHIWEQLLKKQQSQCQTVRDDLAVLQG